MELLSSVHYGTDFDNAFWNGSQMVYGDGSGRIFARGGLTKDVDVIAHELTHGVTQMSAGLDYSKQPGALNESFSDVFGSLVKQRHLGQTAAEADWLIGAGVLGSALHGQALRSMKAPGTANDLDRQAGAMSGYADLPDDNDPAHDSGGVHLNSGIPNRAFQLAAVAIGGTAVAGAGRVWYAALTGSDVPEDADFATFAAATVAAAGPHADAVREAWAQVGVEPAGAVGAPVPQPPDLAAAGVLRVERTGGFAGRTETAEVDLDDVGEPGLRDLVADAGLASGDLRDGDPTTKPDMFLYSFTFGERTVRVPEHRLTASQAELARRVLRRNQF
jgi:hypothetical protein